MKPNTIHSLAILAALPLTLVAGEKNSAPPDTTPEPNPLSFLDGRVVFDVEERVRFEARNNNRDFNGAANDVNDDSWVLSRFRFGLTVQPASWLRIYAQLQDSEEWGSHRGDVPGVNGAEGNDMLDLRQAYVEFADYRSFPLGLTIGRQPLNYGDNRLVGDSRFSNTGKTFDAIRLRLQETGWWVEAFYARPVQIKTEVFDNNDAADNFAGLYFSADIIPIQTTDLYVFYRDKGDAQPDLNPTNKVDARGFWSGPTAQFTTVGTRIKSKPGALSGWDYATELAYQFGDLWASDRGTPAQDLKAFAAHASGGYTFDSTSWKPRIGLEYDYASGDKNPNDKTSQSFQNLFPANHEKYGYLDEFSWRNIHDARAQLTFKPAKNVDVDLDYHAFWLANTTDYWYRSNGLSNLRTTTPDGRDVRQIGARSFAGHEIDIVVRWQPVEALKIDVGYSHFVAGDYLKDTGTHDDADFGYVMTTIRF